MPFGISRKLKESDTGCEPVFVDLSEAEIPGDLSVLRVKILRITKESDLSGIPGILSSGCVLIVNTEGFVGDSNTAFERIRSAARMSGCESLIINHITVIIVPKGVKIASLAFKGE